MSRDTRSITAEALGTFLLLVLIVGSGHTVERLGADGAVGLFIHAVTVGLGLAVVIGLLLPTSGAHFNPAVTGALLARNSISRRLAFSYVAAQLIGAVLGVVVADLSFGADILSVSVTEFSGSGAMLGEALATFGLLLAILTLAHRRRFDAIGPAVGAWVAAAIVATSSTGFANPAVTIARVVTDGYTGIAPGSVPGFLVAQAVGAGLAVAVFGRVVEFSEEKVDV